MGRETRKPTQKLRPGDVLKGSECRIMSTPKDSWFAPKGRLEVIIWMKDAREPTVRYWPKMQMFTVVEP